VTRTVVALAGAVAALVCTGQAAASDVYLNYGTRGAENQGILYARPGEVNDVTVVYDAAGGGYVITDTAGIRIFDQPPIRDQNCAQRNPTTVACRWGWIAISLGDRDDRVDATSAARPDTVQVTRLRGGVSYKITAARGVVANGEQGNDTLIGSAGTDILMGSDFGDEQAEDTGNDMISGGGGPDAVGGFKGNDSLSGGDGDDELFGGLGDDVVDGGSGDDDLDYDEDLGALAASGGNDRISGGAGNDEMLAVAGRDLVDAGDGADEILSSDGSKSPLASTIVCGAGVDKVEPTRGDTLRGCEQIYVVPDCTSCAVSLQADTGRGKSVPVWQATIGQRRRSFILVPLSGRVRWLVQRRGTLRVRFTTSAERKPRDWFVLKR
jgi:Ca2+-binding RTX toxin-like protein